MDRTIRQTLTLTALTVALAGCKAPTVNLATSEPIKVDIDMRLDVYQYSSTNGPAKTTAPVVTPKSDDAPPAEANEQTGSIQAVPTPTPSGASLEEVRRNRAADIQKFKNQRYVGEGHDGLLFIVNPLPKGEYSHYIRTTVKAENADRLAQWTAQANTQKISIATIQAQQGELSRNSAFKGEWIETKNDKGEWIKVPKEG